MLEATVDKMSSAIVVRNDWQSLGCKLWVTVRRVYGLVQKAVCEESQERAGLLWVGLLRRVLQVVQQRWSRGAGRWYLPQGQEEYIAAEQRAG